MQDEATLTKINAFIMGNNGAIEVKEVDTIPTSKVGMASISCSIYFPDKTFLTNNVTVSNDFG